MYIKCILKLLLHCHSQATSLKEELKFSVEVQVLVVLIETFLLSSEESSFVSLWIHYKLSCSSIRGGWWWTIFSAIVSLHFFSQSPRFTAALSKGVSSCRLVTTTVFCSLSLRKYSHPYDAGMAAGLRSWFEVSLLWLKSVQTHEESRSQSYFVLFSHESSVVKGTELTYDSENMKMLQFI